MNILICLFFFFWKYVKIKYFSVLSYKQNKPSKIFGSNSILEKWKQIESRNKINSPWIPQSEHKCFSFFCLFVFLHQSQSQNNELEPSALVNSGIDCCCCCCCCWCWTGNCISKGLSTKVHESWASIEELPNHFCLSFSLVFVIVSLSKTRSEVVGSGAP